MPACARCGVRSQTVGEARCELCGKPLCVYCSVLGARVCAEHAARPDCRPAVASDACLAAAVREGATDARGARTAADGASRIPVADSGTAEAGGAAQSGEDLPPDRRADPWVGHALAVDSFLTRCEAAIDGCRVVTTDLHGHCAGVRPASTRWQRTTLSLSAPGAPPLSATRSTKRLRRRGLLPAPLVVDIRALAPMAESGGPLSAALLGRLLEDAEPDAAGGLLYLVLFSLSDWSGHARRVVGGRPGPGIMLKTTKPVLVGPGADSLCRNGGDVRARELDALLPPQTPAERQIALARQVEALLTARRGIDPGELVPELGCTPGEAMAALELLERWGVGDIMMGCRGARMFVRKE